MPYWDYTGDTKASFDKKHGGWNPITGGGGGNNNKPPKPPVNIPKGPTAAEIAAAKAKAEAEKKALEVAAKKKHLINFKDTQKKKSKLRSKWDTPEWDTDIVSVSLEDFKPNKTLDDYYNQLDETDVPLSDWEQKHMEELEKKNQIEIIDEIKEKEGISNEKLMYPPPGNLAELTDKQKKFIDKKTFPLKENLISPESVYETITNPELGVYDAGTFGFGAQEPTTIEEYNEYLKSKELPTVTAVGAKGGVARKKYSTGSNGILDLDETDGEEISLTAFNPNFDEIPQLTEEEQLQIDSEENKDGEKRIDLFSETEEGDPLNELLLAEDGITTLFMKKGGPVHRHQLAKKNTDGSRPGYYGPDEGHENDPGHGSNALSGNGGNNNNDNTGDGGWENTQSYEDFNKTPVNTNYQPGSGSQTIQDYLTDEQEVNEQKTKEKNEAWLDENPRWKTHLEKKQKKQYYDNITKVMEEISKQPNVILATKAKNYVIDAVMSQIPYANIIYGLAKWFGLAPDIKGQVPTDISGNIIGKNTVTGADLGFFDPEEYPEFWKKGPDGTSDDGTEPLVASVMEELQENEQMAWDPMSYLDKIRANQAKRGVLVEKGIIQDNSLVDESITDITMQANSGGLANLFRVKNQQ